MIDAPDKDGSTPLQVACNCAHVAPARLLLDNGAAVDGRDAALAGPLVAACSAGKHE